MTAVNKCLTMAGANSSYSIFSKIEKFSGQPNEDLTSWLRGFQRCCTITGKDDDLVQGQLLMLCLSGQALAVAERLEETKAAQQKYTELETHLKSVFKSDADKEIKQQQFDKRHAELNETDDEFMLELVKLYRAANPTADDAQVTCNVKRKFLNGIPVELKRNVFIFCSDPHAATVTIDNLLEATRKARLYVMSESEIASSVNVVNSSSNDDSKPDLFEAISRLTDTLNNHMKLTNEQLKTQGEQINAISRQGGSQNSGSSFQGQYNNYDGNRRPNNRRGNNRGRNNNSNRGRNSSSNIDGIRQDFLCHNCNEPNHVARDCRAPRRSLNFNRRLHPED